MNVICFGDSNTYGYDPRGYFGGRYDGDNRWWISWLRKPDGRSRTWDKTAARFRPPLPLSPADTDLLIVMLGTNDLPS